VLAELRQGNVDDSGVHDFHEQTTYEDTGDEILVLDALDIHAEEAL
jgi:hypothetical protein